MAGFIQNIIWNSVEGFVDAAKKTGGEYAGNALIKAGDLIEGGGRSVGGGIEKAATGYGTKLSGQTYQASSASKALPSTARKPAVKRSNSMPANTKPSGSIAGGRTIAGPTSGVPLGAKKTVGGAKKAVGGVTSSSTKAIGGITNTATKTAGGITGGAARGITDTTRGIAATSKPLSQGTSKPYPSAAANSNSSTAYPTAKKTAVKAGVSKPFTPPPSNTGAKPYPGKDVGAKPYPGTNTLPGQGGKVQAKKTYKPAPRLGSQVQPGQKMTHIGAF